MDFDIVQKLKNKRKDIATREGKELFMILSNATIDAMAAALPQTKEELIQIKGWGEKKIKMYGDAFLEVLGAAPQQASLIDEVENKGAKKIAIQIGEEVSPVSVVSPELSLPKEEIFSVSEFLSKVNILFSELGMVKIKGEIDEVQLRNGYAFFTLKESIGGFSNEGSLGCFIGWKSLEALQHLLQNGMEVHVSGYPKIYLKNGGFRLEVTNIEPVGEGALQKAFEALKRKLEEKGYFHLARKRPIPAFIQKIGLITSMSGAVIEDFKKNTGSCGFLVECLDVRVEGDSAEENIVRALRYFNDYRPDLDILVIIRGGGSLQSLKAFNSERVADAIYYSRIPVITGIGHDKDETIAGLVSDFNCSTPTAVANFLRGQHEALQMKLEILTKDLVQSLRGSFSHNIVTVEHESKYLVSAFEKIFRGQEMHLDTLHEKLRYGLQRVFIGFQTIEKYFTQAFSRLQSKIEENNFHIKIQKEKILSLYAQKLQMIEQSVNVLEGKIMGMNPETILKRGYSIAYGQNGKLLKSVDDIQKGEKMTLRLYKGTVISRVEELEK